MSQVMEAQRGSAEEWAVVREVKSVGEVTAIVTGPLATAVHEAPKGLRLAALAKFKAALAEVEGPGMAGIIADAMFGSESESGVAHAA